ncbi:MAG: alpha-mannosidase [Candidatus Berkelbacteria bacterium]|nr:alpha-mannosidase [Candidatus Berkelbacteria bacterium]
MKKWLLSIIIIIILASVGFGFYWIYGTKKSTPSPSTSPTIFASAKKEFTLKDKIAIASYYGWYFKDPAWAETTNAEHPLAGSYNPADDLTIDYQFTLASDIGLDAFLFSWNGIDNPNDQAMIKMISKIETSNEYPNFKIAPFYENINFKWMGPNKTFVDELSYLINLSKEHSAYLKLNGLPVIFVYNPQTIDLNRWQKILDEVKITAGDAYYVAMPDNWDVSDDYFKYFQTITTYADKYISLNDISTHYQDLTKQGKPLIATLIGGTSRIQKSGFDFDRSNGQYLNARYEIAKKNNANWLYITSWNEWFEYSQIEPSRESKFETAKYLREILANFKNKTFSDVRAKWTVSAESQTQIKNDGPGNIYYVRCGLQDKSLLLSLVIKAGEVKTFNQSCPEVSGWLLNNTKIEYKK